MFNSTRLLGCTALAAGLSFLATGSAVALTPDGGRGVDGHGGVSGDSAATYRITVATEDDRNAGTDANVYLTLHGSLANGNESQLDSGNDDFERASTGTYAVNAARSLGTIESVRIRHDNTGGYPGWKLDKIVVHNEQTGEEWTFPCNRWLAKDEDDHLIDRELPGTS
jgi:hypothetical protein